MSYLKNTKKFITSSKDIRSGELRLNGRRLTVFDVVSGVFFENSLNDYISDKGVTFDEIKECLSFCSQKECLKIKDATLCSKCEFGQLQNGETFECYTKNYNKIIIHGKLGSKVIYSKTGNQDLDLNPDTFNYFGDEKDFWIELNGYKGWEMAKEVILKNNIELT